MDNLPPDGWRIAFNDTRVCVRCGHRFAYEDMTLDQYGDDVCQECAEDSAGEESEGERS